MRMRISMAILLVLRCAADGGEVRGKKVICNTRVCQAASKRILKHMDRRVDPCQDFYRFACGNTTKNEVILEDEGLWSNFVQLRNIVFSKVRILLEAEKGGNNNKESFEADDKAKDFYKSCVNEEMIERLGTKPLANILNKLGGWPVVRGDDWNGGGGDRWYDNVCKSNKMGLVIDSILGFAIDTDVKNVSRRVILLDQPTLGLAREYLVKGLNDDNVLTYLRYMVDAAVLMGARRFSAEKEMKDVVKFEICLANISAPKEKRRDYATMYNPTTVGKFSSRMLPGFPPSLKDYVNNLLHGAGATNVTVQDDENIIILDVQYIKKVSKLLVDTDQRIITNYLMWRIVKSRLTLLNKAARDIHESFKSYAKGQRRMFGIQKSKPAWKRCVAEVGFMPVSGGRSLGAIASSMYVRKHFKPRDKKAVEVMIANIRNAFGTMLDNLNWMDENTKRKAKRKLANVIENVGYPEQLLDPQAVEHLHGGLKISPDNFFDNVVGVEKFWRKYDFAQLRQRVDRKDWRQHAQAAVVNAFYNPDTNSMEFPAGILQESFFNSRVPNYLNFGAIGSVIGHELTHGFDDKGRQRDFDGSLTDWWDAATAKEFKKRSQCIIDQYGKYNATQVKLLLNGINTQGENIADNGGLKEAYSAYDAFVTNNAPPEPSLPRLNYTSKQMFWISYAQIWCAKYTDGMLKQIVMTNFHSPGEFRANGPLSNNANFASDFGCAKGSRMNPNTKCQVW